MKLDDFVGYFMIVRTAKEAQHFDLKKVYCIFYAQVNMNVMIDVKTT